MASKFNYAKSVNTADKLIRKFGGPGLIIRPTKGTGPVSNPGKGTPLNYGCQCVVVDYTIKERADGNIPATSKRILVSPKGLQIIIEPTDVIQGPDGQAYAIIPPMSILKPLSTIVLYDLQVKK